MIRVQEETDEKIIHFICEGKITHEDYEKVVIPIIEEKIEKVGSLKAFCDVRKMTTMELKALWEDLKLGFKHLNDVDQMAVVGDMWWVAPAIKISNPFIHPKLKSFKEAEYDEAWAWLKGE